ncbi:Zinc finger protein containing five transmembrane domains [Pseudogymnoascus australis]
MEGSQPPGGSDPPQGITPHPTIERRRSRTLSVLKNIKHKTNDEGQSSGAGGAHKGILHRRPTLGHLGPRKKEKHIKIAEGNLQRPNPLANASSIYMGSYGPSPNASRPLSMRSIHSPKSPRSPRPSVRTTPRHSAMATPRHSLSAVGTNTVHLEDLDHLLRDLNVHLETYGIQEMRDGFFDAPFFKPPKTDKEELMRSARDTLPESFSKKHPLSVSHFLPKQWHELNSVARRLMTTRAGIKLTKSFLGFFIPYILCLIPVVGDWVGRYRYIMVLSALFNHPGRTIGSQIDGAVLTIMGTCAGLGWGALALYVSDSTAIAESGYGGVLAAFLIIFMGCVAALRSYFIRIYQFVVPAGIAAIFCCLAETGRNVTWEKLLAYGIPWALGQAISLVVCLVIAPDGGSRQIALALFDAFRVMQEGLKLPRTENQSVHRQLSWTFVNLSQAYRDLALDISFTRFAPSDIAEVRNAMQAVVRSLLSIKTETALFDDAEDNNQRGNNSSDGDVVVDIEEPRSRSRQASTGTIEEQAVLLVTKTLADPTSQLLAVMRDGIDCCNAVLLGMSGYRKYIGPPPEVSSDVVGSLVHLRKAKIKFDKLHEELINNEAFPATFSNYPDVVELFLFVNPVRQTAESLEALLVLVMKMQESQKKWQFYLPHYPFHKSLQRTNAQVRHDRGGMTTGLFFRSQRELNALMIGAQKSTFQPLPRNKAEESAASSTQESDDIEEDIIIDNEMSSPKKTFRYKMWIVLHRAQGFEMRYALKVAIVVSMLSVPAWLEQSRKWYNDYQSWWAVIVVWIMVHPRTGGNIQDLITRSFCAILGAIWGGVAHAARDGNPIVVAVFAAIYMIPMVYRYTQSSHTRSGLVGCLSFIIVSLDLQAKGKHLSDINIAWTLGVAFIVGVIAAILVSWLLWPFVARHELRKSLSGMIYYSALIYRGVVAQYIYYEEGDEPTQEDITRSEMLEGRLREAFVRMRHLLALTRHEIRLREPFNPLPYSALIESCEAFFENLVEVRQFSLYFHPNYMSQNEVVSNELLPYRRDAVASILMTLYILAGALRGKRRVPRYLPSAMVARKRLLDRMEELEMEQQDEERNQDNSDENGETPRIKLNPGQAKQKAEEKGMRFAQVYQFAYSKGLTQCVEHLEQLQKYTKAICGEVGFDPDDFAEVELKHME